MIKRRTVGHRQKMIKTVSLFDMKSMIREMRRRSHFEAKQGDKIKSEFCLPPGALSVQFLPFIFIQLHENKHRIKGLAYSKRTVTCAINTDSDL